MTNPLEPPVRQRGRASLDFLLHFGRGTQTLRQDVETEIARIVPDPAALPDDIDVRSNQIEQRLLASSAWRTSALTGEWNARMHGLIAREAFEEVHADLAPVIARYQSEGETTLEPMAEGTKAPAYFEGVNFHRTAGGWEDHAMQGYIHGEIVHRKLVNAFFPGGIFKQRRAVAAMAPRAHYARILDMGASTGHFTQALQETYPEAEITGVDLSLRVLEHAQRIGNAHGWAWKLYQRPAEDTGFAEASFDLVASYILLHEIPADVIRRVFAEAFRVLEPGGDMIMSDVTRYADMDKLSVWRADSGARLGGEPYWRESASLDLAQVARDAGFVDVTAQGIYPHVVKGHKPK
ncbi:class I SAM-dependent methyltransferase [Novosphingobium profundi]|uniref:class I SAM-dependent methyltransferase n=1 Tax=Novosphingobium profundi TaxID=1774954 RepID=UPI001BD9BB1F|nr:class I SAM-dependent methyltransferase [Novosphingobium profundi]MBT0668210.1 class I SAM-dependent methyltransferase [Novosphingobium profundi]